MSKIFRGISYNYIHIHILEDLPISIHLAHFPIDPLQVSNLFHSWDIINNLGYSEMFYCFQFLCWLLYSIAKGLHLSILITIDLGWIEWIPLSLSENNFFPSPIGLASPLYSVYQVPVWQRIQWISCKGILILSSKAGRAGF